MRNPTFKIILLLLWISFSMSLTSCSSNQIDKIEPQKDAADIAAIKIRNREKLAQRIRWRY